jgi:hypothetical protein
MTRRYSKRYSDDSRWAHEKTMKTWSIFFQIGGIHNLQPRRL